MTAKFLEIPGKVSKSDSGYRVENIISTRPQSNFIFICVSSDSTAKKDCSIVFKGNPYKEIKMFKNEDGHNGMYIKYREMIIVDSKEGDLQLIETKTKPMPKKTRPAEIDGNLASAVTVSVSSEESDLKGLLPPEALSDLKAYGKNVYYIRMAFINYTVGSEFTENE